MPAALAEEFRRATLVLRVPAKPRVEVDGERIRKTGKVQRFV
jgi:hypothetical protein